MIFDLSESFKLYSSVITLTLSSVIISPWLLMLMLINVTSFLRKSDLAGGRFMLAAANRLKTSSSLVRCACTSFDITRVIKK